MELSGIFKKSSW